MVDRLHRVLLMLMVLLIAGASTRVGACDLVCGLQAGQGGCHAGGPAAMAPMKGMARAESSDRMSAVPVDDQAGFKQRRDEGICRHAPTVASVNGSRMSATSTLVEWSAVEPAWFRPPSERSNPGRYPVQRPDPVVRHLLNLRV